MKRLRAAIAEYKAADAALTENCRAEQIAGVTVETPENLAAQDRLEAAMAQLPAPVLWWYECVLGDPIDWSTWPDRTRA